MKYNIITYVIAVHFFGEFTSPILNYFQLKTFWQTNVRYNFMKYVRSCVFQGKFV